MKCLWLQSACSQLKVVGSLQAGGVAMWSDCFVAVSPYWYGEIWGRLPESNLSPDALGVVTQLCSPVGTLSWCQAHRLPTHTHPVVLPSTLLSLHLIPKLSPVYLVKLLFYKFVMNKWVLPCLFLLLFYNFSWGFDLFPLVLPGCASTLIAPYLAHLPWQQNQISQPRRGKGEKKGKKKKKRWARLYEERNQTCCWKKYPSAGVHAGT